jgi:hypothetical protein
MSRPYPALVIDARPRGPDGPLAGAVVLGRPVLAHLIDLAVAIGAGPVAIHARVDEHGPFRSLLSDQTGVPVVFATGPPPEGCAILRTDRLYDPARLRRVLRAGRDPETAVLWRLDPPGGLAGAADEWIRRQTYQPLGHVWALAPARWLARALCATPVRPNALTLASGALMLAASATVALGGFGLVARAGAAVTLAMALVLDTADGHLARLQGTASAFGRWLDAVLDELGDMTLHAAVAWAAFSRDGRPAWLGLGMLYAMGKYLFVVGNAEGPSDDAHHRGGGSDRLSPAALPPSGLPLARLARLAGHADVRWHLWIALAVLGRLDAALAAYALYFPARALAGAIRKAGRHA